MKKRNAIRRTGRLRNRPRKRRLIRKAKKRATLAAKKYGISTLKKTGQRVIRGKELKWADKAEASFEIPSLANGTAAARCSNTVIDPSAYTIAQGTTEETRLGNTVRGVAIEIFFCINSTNIIDQVLNNNAYQFADNTDNRVKDYMKTLRVMIVETKQAATAITEVTDQIRTDQRIMGRLDWKKARIVYDKVFNTYSYINNNLQTTIGMQQYGHYTANNPSVFKKWFRFRIPYKGTFTFNAANNPQVQRNMYLVCTWDGSTEYQIASNRQPFRVDNWYSRFYYVDD